MSDPQYVIQTVQDLFKVPRDRRAAMLIELSDWMELIDMLCDQGLDVLSGPVVMNSFIWVDDGKEGLREIRLSVQVVDP